MSVFCQFCPSVVRLRSATMPVSTRLCVESAMPYSARWHCRCYTSQASDQPCAWKSTIPLSLWGAKPGWTRSIIVKPVELDVVHLLQVHMTFPMCLALQIWW